MDRQVRSLILVVALSLAGTTLQMDSLVWAENQGPNQPKLKVGMLLNLEGVDDDGALYEQSFWVSGRAFRSFTERRHFQVLELIEDGEVEMLLARWDRQANLHSYSGGLEFTAFVDGPVGTTYQYGNVEAEIVSVGDTVTVPAGTFTDLVQVEKHRIGGSPPWIEWWKPGFFFVKWIDYNVLDGAPPVIWELVSVERSRP